MSNEFSISLINYNTYHPIYSLSYSGKIKEHAKAITERENNLPLIIANEVVAGKKQKYINEISKVFKDKYDIITPANFNTELHFKSIFTSIMVPKTIKHETLTHIRSNRLKNRITAEEIVINDIPITIIGVHMVQTTVFSSGAADWYIHKRKRLKAQIWNELVCHSERERKKPVIICGDMQESSSGENISILKKLGYRELFPEWMPTTNNAGFAEKSIDHIFFSPSAWALLKQPQAVIESAHYTDHAILSVHAKI